MTVQVTAPGQSAHPVPTLEQLAGAVFEREATLPAIEYERRWHTYGDLRRVSASLDGVLAGAAVAPDAPVAFAARNRPAALAALLSLLAAGRTVQMIYPFQSGAGIARDLSSLKPAVFLADADELSSEVREVARRDGIALVVLECSEVRAEPGFEQAGPSQSRPASGRRQIEVLTSGTTGAPKRFPISYDLVASYVIRGTMMFATHGADVMRMPPVLLFFPLGNITGIYSSVPSLVAGLRIVLLDRFSLEGFRDHVRRFQPSHAGLPPSCVQMVLDADVPKEELACIKSLGTGAAPLDPAVQRAFEARYNIPILLSYGATEFGGRVTAMTAELHTQWGDRKLGSVGRPVDGAQVRVVDPDTGAVLEAGQEGLLEVVSPHMGPRWIRTTDVGVVDEDDFVFLRGRADGAITRGGFKILPETIERALLLHPAVAAAAVVGLSDRRLGQTPAAALQVKRGVPEPSAEELKAHLRLHLLATHLPTHFRFVAALPRTPSLKVDRAGVRALFDSEGGGGPVRAKRKRVQ